MARFVLLFVAVLLALPAAGGQRFERGLLWRVDAPGVPASYLYGTLHHDDERVTALAPAVRRAFMRARSYAPELVEDEAAVRRFRTAMVRAGPLLPSLLAHEDYAHIAALLREHGMPADAIARLKPWAAALVLMMPLESPGIIADRLLLLEARRQGKAVTPLETVDEQIDALDGMAADTQLALLHNAAAQHEAIQQSARALVAAYLARDLAAMWRINAAAMGEPEAEHNRVFVQRLLHARSRRFAQRLAPLLRKGAVFAAFGALHLHGAEGVPALLQAAGFRVRRAD